MGAVYEAEHVATGRRVALKMLGQQLDTSEDASTLSSAKAASPRASAIRTASIFGSEEIHGLPVITMEIAGGGTLADDCAAGPLPVAEAVDAILDVISGLEAAFARGVLHRDVKPSNCFVGPDGSVKVGDFGSQSPSWPRRTLSSRPTAGSWARRPSRRPSSCAAIPSTCGPTSTRWGRRSLPC